MRTLHYSLMCQDITWYKIDFRKSEFQLNCKTKHKKKRERSILPHYHLVDDAMHEKLGDLLKLLNDRKRRQHFSPYHSVGTHCYWAAIESSYFGWQPCAESFISSVLFAFCYTSLISLALSIADSFHCSSDVVVLFHYSLCSNIPRTYNMFFQFFLGCHHRIELHVWFAKKETFHSTCEETWSVQKIFLFVSRFPIYIVLNCPLLLLNLFISFPPVPVCYLLISMCGHSIVFQSRIRFC